eukprot:268838-Lingulodinium_polyedra.AAC.1
MKTLQAMAAQQQLRASVEELSREFMSYTAVAAATLNELQQNTVSNYMRMQNDLHLWATDLES